MMGLVYGSKISIKEMTDKKEKIEIIKQDGILSGIKSDSFFRESHSESITLPKGFKLLARSKKAAAMNQ